MNIARSIIYTGPMPEIQVEVGPARHVEAKLGKAVMVPKAIADELIARGDFIDGAQDRDTVAEDRLPRAVAVKQPTN